MRAIVKRVRNLERRMAPAETELIPRLPEWLLKGWEAQGVPIHDGRPDYAAIERIGAQKCAAADSISAGREKSRSPDFTLASKTALRFD